MTGLSADNKLRDVFNPKVITALADDIKRVWPKFEKENFLDAILPRLDELGFMERSNLLRDTLHEFLPEEFPEAVKILIDSLGPELDESDTAAWESFPVMAETAFVSKYGKDHFDISMHAWLHNAAEALARALLHATRKTFEGQTHSFDPKVLAPAIIEFFKK